MLRRCGVQGEATTQSLGTTGGAQRMPVQSRRGMCSRTQGSTSRTAPTPLPRICSTTPRSTSQAGRSQRPTRPREGEMHGGSVTTSQWSVASCFAARRLGRRSPKLAMTRSQGGDSSAMTGMAILSPMTCTRTAQVRLACPPHSHQQSSISHFLLDAAWILTLARAALRCCLRSSLAAKARQWAGRPCDSVTPCSELQPSAARKHRGSPWVTAKAERRQTNCRQRAAYDGRFSKTFDSVSWAPHLSILQALQALCPLSRQHTGLYASWPQARTNTPVS